MVANSQRNARSRFSSSNLIECLHEFESICKTVLAHETGDPGVQFNEKTESQKSRETVPLRNFIPLGKDEGGLKFNTLISSGNKLHCRGQDYIFDNMKQQNI
jgi:hypothetical protein